MKKYGLIGKRLSHSFSKEFFDAKFQKEGLEDHQYILYELKSIHELMGLIESEPQLLGLNVTIPYKQDVMQYIDHLDFEAKKANAVNTICIKREGEKLQLYGYNTDIIGFKKSLRPFLTPDHDRALILGSGGASKAIAVVLDELGIPYLRVSRTPKENEISYDGLNKFVMMAHRFIINTSPVGTYPEVEECPDIPYEFITESHFLYDLTYNPEESLFLKKAADKGALTVNGRSMLEFQAEAAWQIWNNFDGED